MLIVKLSKNAENDEENRSHSEASPTYTQNAILHISTCIKLYYFHTDS